MVGDMNITSDHTSVDFPRISVAGDMGILVEFGEFYAPDVNNAVLAFDAVLNIALAAGVIETVPSFRSLLVRFDPLELSFDSLRDHLQNLLLSENWYQALPPKNRRHWALPVVYGGACGVDLAEVADLIGLREDQVAAAHSSMPLNVAMLGFSPGLAYLGQLPEIWQFPRNTTINPEVPAGAILVAVRQTVLPATPIPTGWRQIGQTPFVGFDVKAPRPFLLSPGDEIRFEPVSEARFASFDIQNLLMEVGL